MRSTLFAAFIAASTLLGYAGPARSQYPVRPIRLVVPFAAGSVSDLVARAIVPPMSEALGQQVVIDNRPGVAGNLGAEFAAKSPPDGYTLFMGNVSHTISVSLYERLGYDFLKDFAPITQIAAGSFMLAVHPSLPVQSVKALIALAKSRPEELNVGVGGAGIIAAVELFKSTAGIRMTNVSYKGTPQIVTALATGEISVGFPPTSAAVPQVKAERLRGLAVTGGQRSPMAPDIATIAEAGLPGYEATTWYCLMAPAGTPHEIVARLNADAVGALQRPEVRNRFAATDITLTPSSPDQLATFLRREVAKWTKVVKASGMRPN